MTWGFVTFIAKFAASLLWVTLFVSIWNALPPDPLAWGMFTFLALIGVLLIVMASKIEGMK